MNQNVRDDVAWEWGLTMGWTTASVQPVAPWGRGRLQGGARRVTVGLRGGGVRGSRSDGGGRSRLAPGKERVGQSMQDRPR